MQVPLEVTFRDIPKSQPVEDLVRQLVDKLERFCDHIERCRVVLEQPHKHSTSVSEYRVLIDLLIPPGHEVVVSWESAKGSAKEDLYKVVHDAFHAAERRVKKFTAQQRRSSVRAVDGRGSIREQS